jgi:hypothetical protein
MFTGVSSMCSTGWDSANSRSASYRGVSAAPARPAQAARVERGVCTPERALIFSIL